MPFFHDLLSYFDKKNFPKFPQICYNAELGYSSRPTLVPLACLSCPNTNSLLDILDRLKDDLFMIIFIGDFQNKNINVL